MFAGDEVGVDRLNDVLVPVTGRLGMLVMVRDFDAASHRKGKAKIRI